MDPRRKSPSSFKHKGAAIGFFVIALAILVVGAYVGIGMLTRYDYSQLLPEDAVLRAKFAVEGYIPTTPAPTPPPVVTPTPLPTPMPTPQATPLPLQVYSLQNTRMVMPEGTPLPGEAQLKDIKVSAGDNDRSVMVTGWAFLEGYDAQQSTVYLVVSAKAGSVHRFYQAAILPGSSGKMHDASKGDNLERADFQAAFKVNTYEEGPYRLGALVVNKPSRKSTVQGYFRLDDGQFSVKGGQVISVG